MDDVMEVVYVDLIYRWTLVTDGRFDFELDGQTLTVWGPEDPYTVLAVARCRARTERGLLRRCERFVRDYEALNG